jgi:hypothetical protein
MRARLRGDEDAVCHEQEIEFAGFGKLRLTFIIFEIGAGAGMRIGVAPIAPADAVAMQDKAKFQLARRCHNRLLISLFG